jgi:hypothetical protein
MLLFVSLFLREQTKVADEFLVRISLELLKYFIAHPDAVGVKPVVTDLTHDHLVHALKSGLALTIDTAPLRARN